MWRKYSSLCPSELLSIWPFEIRTAYADFAFEYFSVTLFQWFVTLLCTDSWEQTCLLDLVRNIMQNSVANLDGIKELDHLCALLTSGLSNIGLPRKLMKSEQKPWVTSINELKRRARSEKQERKAVQEVSLKPPENGKD